MTVALGSRFRASGENLDEVHRHFAEGKQRSILLLKQAVRGLEEEIGDRAELARTPAAESAPADEPVPDAALVAFLVFATISVVRYAKGRSLVNLWRTITAFVLSLPIIHPWYVLWVAPACAGRGRWSMFAWWFGVFAFLRYALDEVAPADAGPVYTPLLAALTVAMIAVPALICLRDTSAPPVERREEV